MVEIIEKKQYVENLHTVQLNFKIPSTLDKEFRKTIFENKGMKKGVMAESFIEAMELWIRQNKNV